jgi:nitrogen regulation protein NR(I)
MTKNSRLLVVDDEPNVRYALEKSFQSPTLDVLTAATAKEGLRLVQAESPDAVILDVRLPDMSGLEVFSMMRAHDPRLPVIIITAHATAETAIEATKQGAFDYLVKPYDLGELRRCVERALELSRLSRVPAVFEQPPGDAEDAADDDADGVDRIIGQSAAMQEVYKEIGRVAPQDVNVLVLGESGTGKELVARAIFQHSRRNDNSFLALNCAAIPETLLESELFGHERGSFTGADRRRIGKFEQAHGGTIFLDEVGDMALATQAKLLRLLQDGRFERLGGNETVQVDVRVVAATHRDLATAIAEGDFREDLFYRLNTFTIRLPPLRQHLEDLPALVSYFVHRFRRELGKEVRHVAPEVLERLKKHHWPGNIRQLQSVLKYALVHATSDSITLECLPDDFSAPLSTRVPEVEEGDAEQQLRQLVREKLVENVPDLDDHLRRIVDRITYEEVLRHVGGHQGRAAEILGISRTTLRSRLQQLGLAVDKIVRNEGDGE